MRDRTAGQYPRSIQANAAAIANACADPLRRPAALRDHRPDRARLGPDPNPARRTRTSTSSAFSAGTWFGAHYASQLPAPRRVACVLDSNTEFTATMQTVVDNQPPALRAPLHRRLPRLDRHATTATYHYGRLPPGKRRQRWDAGGRLAAHTHQCHLHPAPGRSRQHHRPGCCSTRTTSRSWPRHCPSWNASTTQPTDERQLHRGTLRLARSPRPRCWPCTWPITCNDTPWTPQSPLSGCTTPPSLGHRYPAAGLPHACSSRASTGHTGSPLPSQLPAPRHPRS